jgi:hypothetical protein
MAIGVDNIVVVEDVVSCNELAAELCKLGFSRRVSGRRLTATRSDIFVKRMLQELNDLSMTGVDDHENCSSSSYWCEVSVSSSSAASHSTWTGVNYPPYAGGGFGLEQRWRVISAASRSLWKGQKGARDPTQIYQTKQVQRY